MTEQDFTPENTFFKELSSTLLLDTTAKGEIHNEASKRGGKKKLFKPTKGEEKVECETPTFPLSPGQMPTIESTASDEDNYKNKLLMRQ